METYKDKTILITGASSGIGEAFAKRLNTLGAKLILTARSEDKLNDLAFSTELKCRNSYYQTFHGPVLHFLFTFYFIYTIKCDQKAEYGTIKSSIVRISPLSPCLVM